jgi:hypothetical protein
MPGMGVGHRWDWEAADGTEEDSLRVVGCLEKVALVALMAGAPAVHLLDPLAEHAWSASGL